MDLDGKKSGGLISRSVCKLVQFDLALAKVCALLSAIIYIICMFSYVLNGQLYLLLIAKLDSKFMSAVAGSEGK